jgi:hypothetical protein
MGNRRDRAQWMQDIDNRQRNVVFPDTVQNEARFWRNLGNTPWKTSTKIGISLIAVFIGAWITFLAATALREGVVPILVALVLVWGPIFSGLAWAVRRNLKKIEKNRKNGGITSRTPSR